MEPAEEVAMTEYQPAPAGIVPSSLSEAIALANMMATSDMVPECFRGKAVNCLLVIEQSYRWKMSPFAVAQCASVNSGRVMYEGKLVAAVVNARGNLSKRLTYSYSGSGIDRKIVVSGTIREEVEPRTVEVLLKNARTHNACWDKQPDQQLAYHGARVWARRHAPELMLGVYSPEEMPEPGDAPFAPPNVSLTANVTEPEDPCGASTLGEDVLDLVDVFDVSTGEVVRRAPRAASGQLARIHSLLDDLGHHMDEPRRGKTDKDGHVTEPGKIVKRGKYYKKLIEKFHKEHANELATFEAAWVIDWLFKLVQKYEKNMDRGNDAIGVTSTAPAEPEERVPGQEG